MLKLLMALCLIVNPYQLAEAQSKEFSDKLVQAAIELTLQEVTYDPGYFSIDYPNRDVPEHVGVCTEVIIRAYRKLGIDLQKKVHEDMKANFPKYPDYWGLSKPDTNIDHRRVPNLKVFFTRHGEVKKVSQDAEDYLPGDIVTWELAPGVPHMDIVIDQRSTDGERRLIVHNIGQGQEISDCLFQFRISGHYAFK